MARSNEVATIALIRKQMRSQADADAGDFAGGWLLCNGDAGQAAARARCVGDQSLLRTIDYRYVVEID